MWMYLLNNYKYISSVQVLQYYENVLHIKIEWRPRKKVRSAYHCLINDEFEQAEHFRKQFEEPMKERYWIKI